MIKHKNKLPNDSPNNNGLYLDMNKNPLSNTLIRSNSTWSNMKKRFFSIFTHSSIFILFLVSSIGYRINHRQVSSTKSIRQTIWFDHWSHVPIWYAMSGWFGLLYWDSCGFGPELRTKNYRRMIHDDQRLVTNMHLDQTFRTFSSLEKLRAGAIDRRHSEFLAVWGWIWWWWWCCAIRSIHFHCKEIQIVTKALTEFMFEISCCCVVCLYRVWNRVTCNMLHPIMV